MPSFTFRLPLDLSRKLRAYSKVYGAQPGSFVRDMLEATFDGGGLRTQLFQQRMAEGEKRYEGRAVSIGGEDAGAFTAPGQSVKEARKDLKRRKGRPPA
jgi:hypothetical protein